MDIDELIAKYNIKTIPIDLRPNLDDFPRSRFDFTVAGVDAFNEFYQALYGNPDYSNIVRTPSGGISIDRHKGFRIPCYDIVVRRTHGGKIKGIEITLITPSQMCFIEICSRPTDVIGGSDAFEAFYRIFKKYKIDLKDYENTAEEGEHYKKKIEKRYINLASRSYKELIFEPAHHLDFNSSYPTGLINCYPEFEAPIRYMYDNRHKQIKGYKDYYKGVMNSSIGWMQSEYDNYRHTKIAAAALNDNNKRIRELAQKLESNGRIVLLYNTDGIWYSGELYHDEDEGKDLGQWKNDCINCKFRAKSDGAYEYIEDGKYYPVLRGSTKYDRIKPRTEWQWGDIFREDAEPVNFYYVEGEGIKYDI